MVFINHKHTCNFEESVCIVNNRNSRIFCQRLVTQKIMESRGDSNPNKNLEEEDKTEKTSQRKTVIQFANPVRYPIVDLTMEPPELIYWHLDLSKEDETISNEGNEPSCSSEPVTKKAKLDIVAAPLTAEENISENVAEQNKPTGGECTLKSKEVQFPTPVRYPIVDLTEHPTHFINWELELPTDIASKICNKVVTNGGGASPLANNTVVCSDGHVATKAMFDILSAPTPGEEYNSKNIVDRDVCINPCVLRHIPMEEIIHIDPSLSGNYFQCPPPATTENVPTTGSSNDTTTDCNIGAIESATAVSTEVSTVDNSTATIMESSTATITGSSTNVSSIATNNIYSTANNSVSSTATSIYIPTAIFSKCSTAVTIDKSTADIFRATTAERSNTLSIDECTADTSTTSTDESSTTTSDESSATIIYDSTTTTIGKFTAVSITASPGSPTAENIISITIGKSIESITMSTNIIPPVSPTTENICATTTDSTVANAIGYSTAENFIEPTTMSITVSPPRNSIAHNITGTTTDNTIATTIGKSTAENSTQTTFGGTPAVRTTVTLPESPTAENTTDSTIANIIGNSTAENFTEPTISDTTALSHTVPRPRSPIAENITAATTESTIAETTENSTDPTSKC